MIAIVSINGQALAVQPLRDSFAKTESDLLSNSSGRSSETGTAIRYLVRKNVCKLNLKFKGTIPQIKAVEALVSAFTQTVVFVDGGETKTKTMYPGDRSYSDNGFTAELAVNLIEV
ncbi:MAG: hypothetical protein IJ170_11785 [Ruminococcus sp.]|nr:hypothetical protein [Ruminococcus sp.]MBQ8123961.1 hypothetical protein [Ruminococcus sp.]